MHYQRLNNNVTSGQKILTKVTNVHTYSIFVLYWVNKNNKTINSGNDNTLIKYKHRLNMSTYYKYSTQYQNTSRVAADTAVGFS